MNLNYGLNNCFFLEFSQSLDSSILSNASSFGGRFVARFLYRPAGAEANAEASENDAVTLNSKLDSSTSDRPEDSFLFFLLTSRSSAELKAIFSCYQKKFNVSVEEEVKTKISGDEAQYFVTIGKFLNFLIFDFFEIVVNFFYSSMHHQ